MSPRSSLLLGLGAPLGFAALHSLISHFSAFRRRPPQQTAVVACAIGSAAEFVAWLVGIGFSFENGLFALILSLTTAHVYFHFFNMSETARRIRHLVARYRGTEPTSEGGERKAILRLNRLQELGEIKRVGNRFRTRNGLLTYVARGMVFYEKWLFPERVTLRQE